MSICVCPTQLEHKRVCWSRALPGAAPSCQSFLDAASPWALVFTDTQSPDHGILFPHYFQRSLHLWFGVQKTSDTRVRICLWSACSLCWPLPSVPSRPQTRPLPFPRSSFREHSSFITATEITPHVYSFCSANDSSLKQNVLFFHKICIRSHYSYCIHACLFHHSASSWKEGYLVESVSDNVSKYVGYFSQDIEHSVSLYDH